MATKSPLLGVLVALLVVAALGGGVIAVCWWWNEASPPPRIGGPASDSPAGASPAAEDAGAPAPAASPAAAARSAESRPPDERAGPAVLQGTIVGVDPQRGELPALDGHFTLHLRRGEQFEAHEVAVAAGRFATDVARVDAIGITGVVLGEQLARGTLDEVAVPASGRLALRVDLVPPSLLRVVDAATRAPLAAVDLFLDTNDPPVDRLYPHEREQKLTPLLAAARSPLRVPPIDGQPVCWLHADGHAWTRVQLQQLVGGEREVALERGGTLSIGLVGLPAGARVELTVARGTGDDALRWSAGIVGDREGPTTIDEAPLLADLAPGACALEVLAGAQRVGSSSADVRAGEPTRLELMIDPFVPPPEVARVPFRGTVAGPPASVAAARAVELLRLPAEGEPAASPFTAAPRRDLVPDPARSGVATFDFGELAPGRWVATVAPLQVHQLFELGPAGLTTAAIELPPLCDVEIEVVDGHTGERLADGAISWRTADFPPEAPAEKNFVLRVAADPAAKLTRFVAPPGRIVVQAWPDQYDLVEQELELRPGSNRATLTVAREQYVRVLLKEGAANLPISPAELPFDVVRADGSSAETGWARDVTTGALLLAVAAPGDYTLKTPRIPGFAAVPDRAVHVEYGGTTDVVIDLVRE